MPQRLESVDIDVANCYLKMAIDVAKGTISSGDVFNGAIGVVVVQNGDVLGEGQAHLKHGEQINAKCSAINKAEQRAMMAAMGNVDRDLLKGSTVYISAVNKDGGTESFEADDFYEKASSTSKVAGVAWWVMPYEGYIYRYTRREMMR